MFLCRRILIPLFILISTCNAQNNGVEEPVQSIPSVLAITTTFGWNHTSLPDAIAFLHRNAFHRGWNLTVTEHPGKYLNSTVVMGEFDVLVMLITTGDILSPRQKGVFEHYVRTGGAVVGVHSALDTLRDFKFYKDLLGTIMIGHPHVQKGRLNTLATNHSSTIFLPRTWDIVDEFYNYLHPQNWTDINVLLTVDEESYEGGHHPLFHPVSWCKTLLPSRSRLWVTALGHERELYFSSESASVLFQEHLAAGIEWAAAGTKEARKIWKEIEKDMIA